MNQLIKIDKQIIGTDEVNSVNARDLYKQLEIKQEFANWIKTQINTLGLEENIDFFSFDKNVKREIGSTVKKEYIITIDTAKHIAMASRTPKGKEIRNYFISVEKKLKLILENQRVSFLQEVFENQEDDIIRLIDNKPLISHRIISLHTFTPERQILRLIKRTKNILEKYNPIKIKVETVMDYPKGKEPITYYLDEKQVLILLSYLNPNPSYFELKEKIISGFMDYREIEQNKKTNMYLENKVQELETKIESMKKVLG